MQLQRWTLRPEEQEKTDSPLRLQCVTGGCRVTSAASAVDHLWSKTQDWARPELSTSVIHVVVSLYAMDAPGLYGDLLTKDGKGLLNWPGQ